MSNNIGSGTASSLVEYLDKIVEKGRATPGAITPLKTAFVKVVEAVDGSKWQDVEIESMDVDDYVSRFAVLTNGTYTDSSISVYKSRVNKVLAWYKQFQKTPGWMPLIKPRAVREKVSKTASGEQSSKQGVDEADGASGVGGNTSGNMERHEIAFSSGEKAVLLLPINRNQNDLLKVEKFVEYLKATSDIEGNGSGSGS